MKVQVLPETRGTGVATCDVMCRDKTKNGMFLSCYLTLQNNELLVNHITSLEGTMISGMQTLHTMFATMFVGFWFSYH